MTLLGEFIGAVLLCGLGAGLTALGLGWWASRVPHRDRTPARWARIADGFELLVLLAAVVGLLISLGFGLLAR